MDLTVTTGAIGQIQGPFTVDDYIDFNTNKYIKLGISINEKDLMTFEESNAGGYTIQIDDTLIRLGRDGMYELTEGAHLKRISFPQGAPASVIVDYVVLDE